MERSFAARLDWSCWTHRSNGLDRTYRRYRSSRTCRSDGRDRCHRSARRNRNNRRNRCAGSARHNGTTRASDEFSRNVVEHHYVRDGRRRIFQRLRLHRDRQFQFESSAGFFADAVEFARAAGKRGRDRRNRSARSARFARCCRRAGCRRTDGRNGCARCARRRGRNGCDWSARSAGSDGPAGATDHFSRHVDDERDL
jgi:hypothetical protein